jgi:hypothetical protein
MLFVILFPLGVMNVVAMAIITLLIFAEKSVPGGRRIGLAAAAALVIYGAFILVIPDALPTAPSAMAGMRTMPGGMPANTAPSGFPGVMPSNLSPGGLPDSMPSAPASMTDMGM